MKPPVWVSASVLVLAAALFTGCSSPTGSGDVPPVTVTASPAALPETPGSSASAAPSGGERPLSHPVSHPAVVTPCRANHRPQWIFVSRSRQHMWLCDHARVVRDVPVTSGMLGQYTETPAGRYRIQGLNRNTTLTLNTGATYPVRYWIPFDAPLFGFHDSSWQDFPYGSGKYKTDGSHGCIHVPLAAIRFLYRWADIGTPLTIS